MKLGYIRLQRNLLSIPEVADMYAKEGAAGLGIFVVLNLYLSHCEGGWGVCTDKRLSAIAVEAHKHRSDVKRVLSDYDLFIVDSENHRFTNQWMQQQYGKDASQLRQSCSTPARPYNMRADDLNLNLEKENKEKAGCVCPDDTRLPKENHSTPDPSEVIGPSAYELVDRQGIRHGSQGETVPWWAPPQTDIRLRWSVIGDCWTPPELFSPADERQRRREMAQEDFMMKTAYERLPEQEHHRIQDYARREF